MLVEENEFLQKKVRALETLMQSANLERAKFMEGASWVGNKAKTEFDSLRCVQAQPARIIGKGQHFTPP